MRRGGLRRVALVDGEHEDDVVVRVVLAAQRRLDARVLVVRRVLRAARRVGSLRAAPFGSLDKDLESSSGRPRVAVTAGYT